MKSWNKHQTDCVLSGVSKSTYVAPPGLHWFSDYSEHMGMWDGFNSMLTASFSTDAGCVNSKCCKNNIYTECTVKAQRIMSAITFGRK